MFEATLIEGRQVAEAQGLPARQGRSRRRIGILSYSSPGHYYPLTALGRRLQSRGHELGVRRSKGTRLDERHGLRRIHGMADECFFSEGSS